MKKQDLIKLRSFHISKETINRTKRQLSEWERIFANEVINKGLIFKIHKQHNINKSNNPMKKWEKDLNRHFFPDIQMTNKYNITNTQRDANQSYSQVILHTSQNVYHLKNPQINAGEDVPKRESSYI